MAKKTAKAKKTAVLKPLRPRPSSLRFRQRDPADRSGVKDHSRRAMPLDS